jgi:diguanylate cyclase (GGDEF)-like protein
MKTKTAAKVPPAVKRAESLTKVIGQSEHVNELVTQSAQELLSVNKVLKNEVGKGHAPPVVENALGKSEAIKDKVQDASEKLSAVNKALTGEVLEREKLEHELDAITEQESTARHASLHDVLTALPNRTLFKDRLEHGLVQAKRHGWILALMFIDLDKFKSVNDTHGHDAGDVVLKTVALRLSESARGDDTVSRYGGDEFLYLLTEIHHQKDAAMIAKKIIKVLRAPCPVSVNGLNINLRLSASIGISLFPKDATTAGALIKRADEAMYRAKKIKDGYAFASEDAVNKALIAQERPQKRNTGLIRPPPN